MRKLFPTLTTTFFFFLFFILLSSSFSFPINGYNKEEVEYYFSSPSVRRMSNSAKYGYINPRALMKCDRFPRICRAKGSPGPDCCKKRCVNVKVDGLNCGRCGKKCRYGERCCSGRCVNVLFDGMNCGACRKRCKKGSFCRYGMCSYA